MTSPSSVVAPTMIKPEPLEPESSDVLMSVSMESEPSVNQDTDLEIEGGGVDAENIDPGTVECMEVEEEEDINGDVIRCLCNESEEGGFMIQVGVVQSDSGLACVTSSLGVGLGTGFPSPFPCSES